MGSYFTMESLPEDMVVEICAKIAAGSVKEIHNLQIVSKTFHRISKDPYVLRGSSLNRYPLYPWFRNEESRSPFNAYMDMCLEAYNPEAVYRAGVVQFFHSAGDKQKEKEGLQQLRFATEMGVKLAAFFYGPIIICLGGETKRKGMEILSQLRIPFDTWNPDQYFMPSQWCQHFADLRGEAQPMVQHLKSTYVREKCSCEGLKEGLLRFRGTITERLDRFSRYVESCSSFTCEICFCHLAVEIFFDVLDISP